jgi:recombination protein RecT
MLKKEFVQCGLDIIGVQRFIRIALNNLQQDSKLAMCNPLSIIGALLSAAQLGLEPNTQLGECYLIPYGGYAQFVIGYQGRIKLFMQSDEADICDCIKVYSNDTFTIAKGEKPTISHTVGPFTEQRHIIGYYAFAKLKSGYMKIVDMSILEIEAMKALNPKRFKSDAWKTDFHAMAMKTVIGECLDYMPISTKRYGKMDNSIKFYDPYKDRKDIIDMSEMPNHYYEIEKHTKEVTS